MESSCLGSGGSGRSSQSSAFKEEQEESAPGEEGDGIKGHFSLKGQHRQRLRKGSSSEHQSSRKAIEAVPGPGEAGRGQVCWGLWVGESVRFYSMDEGMSWKDFKLRPSKVPFTFEDYSCGRVRTAW